MYIICVLAMCNNILYIYFEPCYNSTVPVEIINYSMGRKPNLMSELFVVCSANNNPGLWIGLIVVQANTSKYERNG